MKVLITGGTGTLGKALIEEFAEGNEIIFTYHNNKKLASALEKQYGITKVHTEELENIEFKFDIIINNAAISGEINKNEFVSVDSFKEVMYTNVVFPFTIIKKSLPYMKENKFGRIINISSVYAVKVEEELGAFNCSKAALVNLTKSITKEYAKYGITSNAVLPGTFESDISNKFADIYSENEESKESYYQQLISDIPAGRLGNAREIARLVKFLSSDDAAYINGAEIVIDGGYSV